MIVTKWFFVSRCALHYFLLTLNACSLGGCFIHSNAEINANVASSFFVDVQWTVWFLRWEHTGSAGKLCEFLLDCFSSFRYDDTCAVKVCKYECGLHSRFWQLGQSSRDLHLPRGTSWASTWNRERIWSFETNAPVGQQPAFNHQLLTVHSLVCRLCCVLLLRTMETGLGWSSPDKEISSPFFVGLQKNAVLVCCLLALAKKTRPSAERCTCNSYSSCWSPSLWQREMGTEYLCMKARLA